MSPELHDAPADLVRWTFAVDPARREAIEAHLDDLGADVLVRDGRSFLVAWEEPGAGLDAVLEALWALHGSPFEVTQEEFARVALHTLHHADDEPARDAA